MYDRYGSSFETRGGRGPGGGAQWQGQPGGGFSGQGFEDFDFGQFFGERFGGGGEGIDLGDIFRQFRRGGGERPRRGQATGRRRGGDIEHEIQIPFTTSITGGEAQLSVQRQDGHVDTISVKIPPGVEDGKKIRLRGQGEPAPGGGTPGDILLTVRVAPHPYFQRRGNDLNVKVPVTLGEAALGAKIDVPTPRGTVALQVPPGSSSGVKLRVKGHGVAGKDRSGDLFAEIQIVLPKQFDDDACRMIRKLEERAPKEPRANLRW
ncbi:MAG: J domain-containing protein [Pirellulales bacterium]|nr:J domain-containing protein [Pirellulales bacterium]